MRTVVRWMTGPDIKLIRHAVKKWNAA